MVVSLTPALRNSCIETGRPELDKNPIPNASSFDAADDQPSYGQFSPTKQCPELHRLYARVFIAATLGNRVPYYGLISTVTVQLRKQPLQRQSKSRQYGVAIESVVGSQRLGRGDGSVDHDRTCSRIDFPY
jgi:hypothetical protein